MELRAVSGIRVCAECGQLAQWVFTYMWAGLSIHLCDEHFDTLGCLMPKPKKPEPKTKQPKRVVY